MEVDDRGKAVFSHADFGELLARFVEGGGVRYEAWSRDVVSGRQLDAYLERIARISPDTAPNLFPTQADRALYWVCAHNAFAIRSILRHWPVESVREIEPGWQPFSGYGYYRKARFAAGGRKMSLAGITGGKLPAEARRDARVLLLVNCGSASCAPLRPEIATTTSMEGLLASATAAFLSDPAGLRVIHAERRIQVSAVLKRGHHMVSVDPRSGRGRGKEALRRWLFTVAPPAVSPDIALAREYSLEFMPWDWSIKAR